MESSVVVSLGGNAILPVGKAGTIEEQFRITRETMRQTIDLVRERPVVFTHGNGPIVGNILIRNEAVRQEIPPMPLDVCGADSQGGLGYMMQQTLQNLLREASISREVATIITQTVVDETDPGFQHPTKPIGPFYDEASARELQASKGWRMVQDAGRGWRRVVPSPMPRRIVELPLIRKLHESGHVVIAAGGGGIPVIERPDGTLAGVEAVIDKDLASVVLALELGARSLIIVTAVERVAIDFGKPEQRWIERMSVEDAERYLKQGQFPPGSMGPKIAAAIWFLRSGGREICITNPATLHDSLAGRAGTWITASGERVRA
ncbi:MAG: carbamate kinase [Candidatus Eisenbacteria bacterium]|nr:carbamate kinase [Candidatus Eisenbacteria bacterium]